MTSYIPKLDIYIDGECVNGKTSLGKKAPDILSKFMQDEGLGSPPDTYAPKVHDVRAVNASSVALTRLRIYFRPTQSGDYFGTLSPNYEFKTILGWMNMSFDGTTWYTMATVDATHLSNPTALLGTRERPVNVPDGTGDIDSDGKLIPGNGFTFKLKVEIPLNGSDIYDDVEALADVANALKTIDMCIRYGASSRWVEENLSGT